MSIEATGARSSLGPYRILAPLGSGGTGEVYRAWDPRLEREVALKILRERSETDPYRVQRFIAEARAVSALNHPNILTVFDAAVDGAMPYIVSELIDGESLRSVLRRGPLPLKKVLDLAAQIADGLAHAHAAGIVHRDLKPENIMVTGSGRAKILDFGLAQPLGLNTPGGMPADVDAQTITDPGLLAGTVPYMSPEQARGTPTDFRSDQFSFGLILYEMTAGRPAFRRDTPAETLEAITGGEPEPVGRLNPHTPLLLAWIIERCLAKNPDDRYAATSDLERDLRTLRDRLAEIAARDSDPARPASRPSRLRRALPIAMALALFAAGVVIWRLAADPPRQDPTTLHFTPFATEAVYKGFPAWSPADPQTVAYVAEVSGVLQVFTRRKNSSTAAQVTDAAYDCKHPFWSPDGRRIYYVSMVRDREGLWSVPAAGGAAQNVVENATRGAISPDGKTLAFLRDETRADVVGTAALWLTTVDGSAEPRRYDREPFGGLRFSDAALSFSPDGAWLGVAGVPGTIALQPDKRGWQFWMLPTDGGTPARRLVWWTDVAPRISNFSWMPDSRHIVMAVIPMGGTESDLWITDMQQDRAWPLSRGPVASSYPSVSPSGEEVVFVSDEPHYDVMDLPLDGSPARTLIGTSRNETDPVWSPAAKAYVYVTDRGGQDEIWLRTGEGPLGDRPVITQANFENDRTIMLAAPAVSPDGRRVAYQRNASRPVWPLRIWYSVISGGTPVPLLPETHDTYQGPPTWSPDGQWLAFAEWDTHHWNLLKVRVAGAEGAVTLRSDGIANATPQWSPGGDWITWETENGFLLVSASDGRQQQALGSGGWLVHTWSRDGTVIYGIRQTDDLRLALLALDVRTGRERLLSDLGPAAPVNNQVKGLSVGPGGRTLVTSLTRMRGDLWILDGVHLPTGLFGRLWARPSP